MRWTWDPDKAAANRAKHGVSFETAKAVFDALTAIAGKPSGWLGPSCCLSFTLGLKVMTTRSAA